MATKRETNFDDQVVPAAEKINRYLDRPLVRIAELGWQVLLKLPGGANRSAATVLGWIDENLNRHIAKQEATNAALIGALNAVNKGEKFDEAKLLASITAAAEQGVKNAVGSITREEVTVVTLKEEGTK